MPLASIAEAAKSDAYQSSDHRHWIARGVFSL